MGDIVCRKYTPKCAQITYTQVGKFGGKPSSESLVTRKMGPWAYIWVSNWQPPLLLQDSSFPFSLPPVLIMGRAKLAHRLKWKGPALERHEVTPRQLLLFPLRKTEEPVHSENKIPVGSWQDILSFPSNHWSWLRVNIASRCTGIFKDQPTFLE